MKEYFKYANGYVNLNDENIFLTNSGNWSETLNLLEKSPKSIRQNNIKSFKIYIYLIIVACLIFLLLSRARSGSIPFGLILLGLGTYSYFKRETGKRYKIPISKIINISISENEVKISFYNSNGNEDFEILTKVDNKGLDILSHLKSIIT
jgi:hypothetical protein